MKKKLLIGIFAVVMCFALTGCGEGESNNGGTNNGGNTGAESGDANETITTCNLKAFSNENNAVVYFENGKSVKIEVEETLGSNYSDGDKEQYRSQKERTYGEATLEGDVVKYTITEDTMYIGQERDTFIYGFCKK